MTVSKARKIVYDYLDNQNPGLEEEDLFFEAIGFLIHETHDPEFMNILGAVYYGKKRFDLALKYYEMAEENGDPYAAVNLGYIWYYGRTGVKDYEKAFRYFEKGRKRGDMNSAYKLADMYRNGYYVEKDPQKYKEIIEELYRKIRRRKGDGGLVPEIYTRLAGIRTEEGKTDEALELYDQAREELTWRIMNNPFFGNLTIMKLLIWDVYELRPFDPENIDLYDCYYLFQKPCTVRFKLDEEQYEAECVIEDGAPVIRFGDKWFRNADDFFAQAEIDGELLTTLIYEFYDYEVEYGSDQR